MMLIGNLIPWQVETSDIKLDGHLDEVGVAKLSHEQGSLDGW